MSIIQNSQHTFLFHRFTLPSYHIPSRYTSVQAFEVLESMLTCSAFLCCLYNSHHLTVVNFGFKIPLQFVFPMYKSTVQILINYCICRFFYFINLYQSRSPISSKSKVTPPNPQCGIIIYSVHT